MQGNIKAEVSYYYIGGKKSSIFCSLTRCFTKYKTTSHDSIPPHFLSSAFFLYSPRRACVVISEGATECWGSGRGSGKGALDVHLVLQDDAVVRAAGRRLPRDADARAVALLQRRQLDVSGRGAWDWERRRQIKMALEPKVLWEIKVGPCTNKDPETWKRMVAQKILRF